MKVLDILERYWFSKAVNSYHTVEITIDGRCTHYSDIYYGHGIHYLQTAKDYLEGAIPGFADRCSVERYCDNHDIRLVARTVEVPRRKDL